MEGEGELRRRAEGLLRHQRGTAAGVKETQGLAFELDVHRIELELQNAELRQLDAELLSSRERYQQMFEESPVAMLLLDPESVILELNLAAAAQLGGERWRFVGRKLAAFMAQRDADQLKAQLAQLEPEAAGAEITVELRDREGRERGARLFSRRSASGVLVVLVPTATAEADRRRWLHAEALRHVAVPIVGADTYGRIEVANPAAERLLGYAWAELEGQPLAMLTRGADLSAVGPHVAIGKDGRAIAIDSKVEIWWESGERHRTITLRPPEAEAPGEATPASPTNGGAPAAQETSARPVGPRRAVLVMASHVPTRAAIAELLFESGLEVFLASDPAEAAIGAARLVRDGVQIAAVVSEPEEVLGGTLALVSQLRARRPGLKIAFVAGLGVEVEPSADLESLVVRLPFDTRRLLVFIDELLDQAAS